MQNIDYARVIHRKPAAAPVRGGVPPVRNNEAKNGFVLLMGAIFIFTAGIFVGMGIESRESEYKGNSVSFRNFGKNDKDTDKNKTARADEKPGRDAGIQYPPKEGEMNFVIHVGDYASARAGVIGKQIIGKLDGFQGRIFKTASGRLYIGYFYKKAEAEAALKKLTSSGIKEISGAELKSVRF